MLETGRKFGGKLSVGPTSKTAHTYDGRNGQAYSMARAIRCMRERYFHRFMEGKIPTAFGVVERTSKPFLFWLCVAGIALGAFSMAILGLGLFGTASWPVAHM